MMVKSKLIHGILSVVMLLAMTGVNTVNAKLITVENWHLTTDELGGLRQSSASEQVFYAVSKIWQLDRNDTFEALDGYYFATHQEWRDLVGFGPNSNRGYKNQGGWNDYEWEGKERYFFLFADTLDTGWYKHAGNNDTTSNHTGFYQGRTGMAGFVMIKGEREVAGFGADAIVPEPTTIAILSLGIIALFLRRIID
ncbi:PEP-CTERM sorting domain-containing protein [Thalassotalea profundi]|uniref:Ice-binding protein C-terminal domain-containing protein n=1 Tax=Thalassotalea profundi TaxID=2036687 RepID=A0ABQ3IJL0_9GAMM|nr:PEP-CTERM sorting domain-containing protein [Thalassotalea profundi]GHE86454.1 hypothetical protein GCM10011501_14550 [Thalassotalea profundi]